MGLNRFSTRFFVGKFCAKSTEEPILLRSYHVLLEWSEKYDKIVNILIYNILNSMSGM